MTAIKVMPFYLLKGPVANVHVVHVPTAPPLVAVLVCRVVAWAGVRDLDDDRRIWVLAHCLAVQLLPVVVLEGHGLACDFVAPALQQSRHIVHSKEVTPLKGSQYDRHTIDLHRSFRNSDYYDGSGNKKLLTYTGPFKIIAGVRQGSHIPAGLLERVQVSVVTRAICRSQCKRGHISSRSG